MTQTSTAKDIRDYLIAQGVTTDIFINLEPSTPINCITIYTTGSWNEPNPKFLIDYPTIQIRSRATTDETCFNNLLEVFDILHGVTSFTQNTTKYTGIQASTSITNLEIDKNDNRIKFVNFNLITEPEYNIQNRKQLS